MLLKEDKDILSKEDKDFLENNIINNVYFPMYLQKNTAARDGNPFMCHTIVTRIEDRLKNDSGENSTCVDFFKNLTLKICQKYKLKFNKILRCAVNLTYNNGAEKTVIHLDHEIPHKQIIIYLNDPLDKKAKTILLNDNNKIIKEITPSKFKTLIFDCCPHYFYYPKVGHRLMCIITFN